MDITKFITEKFKPDIPKHMPIYINNINRTIMAETLAELNFNVGAEIGVAQGNHSLLLCEKNKNLHLYCIDVWEKYKGFNEYEDRIDRYFKEAKDKLTNYNVSFIKKFSMDAVKDFEDGSLDFVYIDGAHDFKNVADDICEWSKKVKIGGIVFGHDYKRGLSKGKYVRDVVDVVQAYCYAKKINPWFVLENKIRDEKFGWDNPAWLFVRQETDLVDLV
jgi:hypothetical protein